MEQENKDKCLKCLRCKKNDAEDEHTCPYAEDIFNDCKSLCNCCSDCQHDCARDI